MGAELTAFCDKTATSCFFLGKDAKRRLNKTANQGFMSYRYTVPM
jgi:hypothetical protein